MKTVAVENAELRGWVSEAVRGALSVCTELPADIVIGDEEGLASCNILIADPVRIVPVYIEHVIRRSMASADLRLLLISLAQRAPIQISPLVVETVEDAQVAQAAFAASRQLASGVDLVTMELLAEKAVKDLLGADRVYCLFYDFESGALWSAHREAKGGDARRAIAGMAGFAAKTGLDCVAECAKDDHRYLALIDDPVGDGSERIVAQAAVTQSGEVQAVLVAVRRRQRPSFEKNERKILHRFALLAAPLFEQLSAHVHAESVLSIAEADTVFHREAIAAQAHVKWGDVLRVRSPWISRMYWGLVAVICAVAVAVWLIKIPTYSSGIAVVRSSQRSLITARAAGNVDVVLVSSGDTVEPGAVIIRLDDSEQRAVLERATLEFETQLRNHMQNISDPVADLAVRESRNDVTKATIALEQRLVRATTQSVIGDVRVRSGQYVKPGEIIAAASDSRGGLDILALLPGQDRPQVVAGMTMRLELAGYRYAYQPVNIDSVSSDVLSPTEARRVLGAEVSDSVEFSGPVMVVRGHLRDQKFKIDGQLLSYHDGMIGRVDVRVRNERLLFMMFPSARSAR